MLLGSKWSTLRTLLDVELRVMVSYGGGGSIRGGSRVGDMGSACEGCDDDGFFPILRLCSNMWAACEELFEASVKT